MLRRLPLRLGHTTTIRLLQGFTCILTKAYFTKKILQSGGLLYSSLLVGGIGIMNIMLVSVTERTQEIGLRKALGARRSDIMIQFLTESALLSLIGGLIGILLGWLLGILVGAIANRTGTPLNPQIEFNAVLLATIFSAAVGIFFGYYPASRASKLQPVEALRYE